MKRHMLTIAGLLTGLIFGGAGMAVASSAFDNSTPPTSPGWMTRPCSQHLNDIPLLTNCYWNNTMGVKQDGYWIRKIPGQPIVCYLLSPDDAAWSVRGTDNGERCYATTTHKRWFIRKVWDISN